MVRDSTQESDPWDSHWLLRINRLANGKEHDAVNESFLGDYPQSTTEDFPLPNHPVRSRQHIRRNREADLLGGFEINDQLEFSRLLDRQIGRLGALENFVHITWRHADSCPRGPPRRT